jgi:hypothetical protein
MFDTKSIDCRFSNLKRFSDSAAHYLHQVSSPDVDTPQRMFGRVVHSLILGGGETVVIYSKSKTRQGKAWDEFKVEHDGSNIMLPKEFETARRCADAVLADERARPWLVGTHEHSIYWENCGRKCSSRVDVIGKPWDQAPNGFVTELKTSFTSHPWRFSRHAIQMHYPAQVAWYQDAARAIGRICQAGVIVAVESKAPHVVTTFRIPERVLENGRKLARTWLEQLLACEAAGVWPGYVGDVIDLQVPESDDFELDFGDDEEEAA